MNLGKLWAALLCPLLISLVLTLLNSPSSFGHSFIIGYLILTTLFFVLGIPLSGFADYIVFRYCRNGRSIIRFPALLTGYALAGAIAERILSFVFHSPLSWERTCLFAAGGIFFLAVQWLTTPKTRK